MNRNIRIIMNPKAGKQTAKSALFTICDKFCAMEDYVEVCITQHAGHAKKLAKESEGKYDIVVCVGGDGTWNEVVSGTMECTEKPNLAYLPSGTVNDFAATLKLSKNVDDFMNRIQEQQLFSCDIGSFNHRFFTYVAAFGIFTDISYSTPQSSKNIFGRIAYFLEGVKQLTNISTYSVKAIIDHEEVIEDTFIFGCVTNSKYVAGFPAIYGSDAKLDDGLFEILLIKAPDNPLDIQTIITALLKQEVNETWMYYRKASHVDVVSNEAIPWTLDGEDGGSTMLAKIENKNRAITLFV